jgi:DNA polymerase III subunit beta
MEIVANREQLAPVLNRVIGVVERKQTLPILGHFLLRASAKGLAVVGTDMEMEVRARSEAQVLEEGVITVPARKLADICRTLPDGVDIRLKVTGDRCVLTAGRGRYVLGTLPAQNFPVLEAEIGLGRATLEEAAIKRILDKTAFAMAQQDVRYYLNGLFLQMDRASIRAVATDGHRMACFDHSWELGIDEPLSVIVPFKTVSELRRQMVASPSLVEIEIGERAIRFHMGDTVISSKLIDGRYPEYQRVIPSELGKEARADREALRKALGRTSILSNEKYRGVRLGFEPGVLRLQAHNPEQEEAVEEMELEYEGEPTMIGYNVSYLSDVLGAVDVEQVEVRFQDGNSSSIWRGVGAPSETYVVMPMRL